MHDEVPDRDTVLDDQSANSADSEPCPTVTASPRALFAVGVGGVPPTPSAHGVSANRFFHLGIELESESPTQEISMVRRRLSSGVFQEEIPPIAQSLVEVGHTRGGGNPVATEAHDRLATTSCDHPEIAIPSADSHEERLKRVRSAMQDSQSRPTREARSAADVVRSLALRIGRIDVSGGGFPGKSVVYDGRF